ncbi:major facilitator superfamily domain-containing protein [Apodospora peruviana]|uniref:Major facilitator superfamily domain-containing protein n=1 Tax=Apodospora peruviana TaxID=516989 RepID=A0AAE0LYI5_9PEZI|nr:major facilitator superfamily domain-containing protein [Apodospora peruviana]
MSNQSGNGLVLSVPPSPPAKEMPQKPAPLSLPASRPGTATTEPPNRPLPATPTAKTAPSRPVTASSDAFSPKKPSPAARPPPLRPQAPLRMNPPTRPGTAASQVSTIGGPKFAGSTKRLSWGSIASSRRPIKYGQGKYRNVELVPQPSDDPDDPLNWPMWKKELNFFSLLLMVAMTGVMKTIFISVNAQLTERFEVSYTAAAALTGAPLMISAFAGFLCLIASRICGKRPLYLVSLLAVFIGAVWNTNVATSYGQCMAARVFQGLGWGAFDALVLGSIQDTYFEHERGLKVAIYSIVAVSTTWGAPLLGGVASQSQAGFGLQFAILSAFFVVAVPAITLGAPETVFDRAYTLAQTPATAATSKYKVSLPLAPRRLFSLETFNNYVVKMKPYSYTTGVVNGGVLLQAPRAFIAPTTVLLFLISFLPYCVLWGLSSSLSLLFHPMPFVISPGSLGTLVTGPWILATAVVAVFALALPAWHGGHTSGVGHMVTTPGTSVMFTPKTHMVALAGGSVLAFMGVLTFGLHIDASMTRPEGDDGMTSVFALEYLGAHVNFPAVSFMLGLLAAGVYVLDATVRPLIRASTMFTSSNLGVALRNTTDMGAGVGCWRQLFAGVFVIAVPNAVWSWDGLRGVCIGVAIAQMVVAAVVGSVWWLWDENVRRWDGRVMRLVDLDMLKRTGSFFDTD